MWTFILAGIVYLLGVGIVLYIKPSLMFTPDGEWKEFGIGQRDDRYSPFPLWLFCLVWAIVSYIGVTMAVKVQPKLIPKRNVTAEIDNDNTTYDFDGDVKDLPKGYYVLNKKATRLSGVPKYVFLGSEEP